MWGDGLPFKKKIKNLPSGLEVEGKQFYPVGSSMLSPQNGGHVETHALFLARKTNPLVLGRGNYIICWGRGES